ncbi:hypothetical protein HPB48_006708 [Haemaphysalis longicornis]|uniref:ATP-dependent RNA helicase YTHDC2 n=1 Tax=Haemaphysalis longicornis TaxID=44386 RepID=A0A9J6FW56_HAELO|nr:hypothetical protein HPB48_006708 [Haemaphysalis longicornis]
MDLPRCQPLLSKGTNRFLTAYKKVGSTIVQNDAGFTMGPLSCQYALMLLQKFPVNAHERQELLPPTERDRLAGQEVRDVNRTTARLSCGVPQIPPPCEEGPLEAQRQRLPIWQSRPKLLSVIGQSQVTIVVGETGCGKTTQVPQYLLEQHASLGQPCRIVCTEPRRLAAVAVAERIAVERNEKLGHIVGYQIRLENRVSPKTLLTVCTNGILLRTLMGNDSAMASLTHIIVEEEREEGGDDDLAGSDIQKTRQVDRALTQAWMTGSDEAFSQLLYYFYSEGVSGKRLATPVSAFDYRHSETSATALMLAAGRGKSDVVEELLSLGADPLARTPNDWTAVEWAQHFNHSDTATLIMAHVMVTNAVIPKSEAHGGGAGEQELTPAEREQLDLYQRSVNDDQTDLDLVLALLRKVHASSEDGAILVFLAGYDDMSSLKERIMADKDFSGQKRYALYMLHSNLQCSEQRLVFNTMPPGVRKIILSTNIAETSITISDVTFVIDSGKVKEKSFDSLTGTSLLKSVWVSQASAVQRRGRAGRTRPNGVCFHLFSRQRFASFEPFQQPELLRLPLQELCLQAKLLVPTNVPIADFLARAPDPPAFLVTRTAVTLLKTIDALDPSEQLTEVGLHLLDLPIEPQLGKMLLYAVVLKCLDPVLTIVCCLTGKDPFVLPSQSGQKRAACMARRKLSADTYSDHMALLRAFQPKESPVLFVCGNSVRAGILVAKIDFLAKFTGAVTFCILRLHRAGGISFVCGRLCCAHCVEWRSLLPSSACSSIHRAGRKARSENSEHLFCERHFVSSSTMSTIVAVRGQLLAQLRASGFVRARGCGDIRDLNSNSDNWPVVKAALVAGSYPNLLRVDRERRQLVAQRASRVRFHMRSALAQQQPDCSRGAPGEAKPGSRADTVSSLPTDWVIYGELARAGPTAFAHLCTLVSPITVALFAGPLRLPQDALYEPHNVRTSGLGEDSDSEEEEESELQKCVLKLDDWISLKAEPEARDPRMALQLRQKLQALFLRRMHAPTKPWSQVDEAIVRAVVGVLSSEEDALNLPKPPPGFGQRPRPLASDGSYSLPPPSLGSSPGGHGQSDGFPGRRAVLRRGGSLEYGPTSSPSSRRGSGASLPATPICMGRSDTGGSSRCSDDRSDCSSMRTGSSGQPSPCCLSPKRVVSGHQRFYIIKAGTHRAVDVSVSTGLWALGAATDRKIQAAIREGKEVVLVFSVQGSGHFQGYAVLLGPASNMNWPTDEYGANSGGRCYFIEWKHRCNLPFQNTRHLLNPWNENRKVQVSRDGQELEPSVGEALCRLWDGLPDAVAASHMVRH